MTRLRRTNLEGKKGTGNNSVKKGRCKKNDNHLLGKVQQVSNYCLRGNKNTAFKDKLLQVPVVVLDKYSIPSTLLEKLCYPGDIVFDHKMTSTSSTNNSYVGSAQCLESNKPNSDRMKCIQSFKITAQLNEANSRKIDIIPLPIETTVSMHYEQPKTSAQVRTVRKRLWCLHNDEFKEDYLRSLCNITSSNSIFRNAFLEHEISSRPVTGTRLSLSRTVSNASLNTISNTDVWVSSKARSYEHQHCDTSKYYSTKKVRLSFEEYDCPSKDGTLVRSDSSGYHSEQKLSDNSSSSSIASSPKRQISSDYVHNITVTVNCSQEKIPKLSLQHSPNHVTSSKRRCDFKTPKLPLFKRPPTRIKPNVGSTVNSSARSTSSISVMSEDNSDTISLFAETICYDLDNDDNQNGNRYIPKKSVSTPILRNDTTDVENKKGNFIVTDRILQSSNTSKQDNLVNKPHVSERAMTLSPLLNKTPSNNDLFSKTFDMNINNSTNKISDWVASTSSPKCPVNINNILNFIKKLCHYHFRNRKCFREDKCKFSHKIPNEFQNNLRELNEEQFRSVLKEILKYKYLFKDCFEMILMYYKENNHQQDLVYLIEDILKLDFDKTPFIKAVILALRDMGYTFVDAISEILWTHGTKTESLMDILLMIIVEEDDCLENNWHFIDKITKFRKDKLDYGVVSEIFQKCCNTKTPNRDFCENIYKDLIIKSHIELCKIDRNLVIKYINLLYYFNFIQYAEQLKQNNGINDHELTIKVQETEIYVKSGETTSYTSTNESSSSSDNSEGIETSQIERNKRIPNLQEQRILPANSEIIEDELDFAGECINPEENEAPIDEEEEEDEDGTEEEESEGTEEETETNNIEQTSHIFQLDLPLQKNHNYANSEVDTYLNSVNRDLYSLGNYYTMSEPPIKRSSIADKENYKSLENERSIDPSCSESPTPSNNAEIRLDLSDSDIVKLVASTNKDDISAILSIMKNSADNNLHRPFTIHMLTALKKLLPANAIKLIVDIFQNLGNLIPHILHQAPNMKHIMRLLAFNVLPYLDKRKEYGAATRIIDVFSKEIDEFIKTESITQYEWLSSTKLRYIFIFKIFVRDKKLREALKLLKNSSLALFQNLTTGNELEYKQRVLNEFMETALQTDLQIAKEGILYLMLNMDSLQNIINLGNFLNQLLVRLLNFYSIHKYDVLGLIDNIVNGWFKHLKHSVMRALLVQTFYDLPEQKVLEFFHLCVEVGVYRIHDGFDNSIEIPRNLLPEEILFVLHIHFHKICKSNFPLHNIVISMELQIEADEYTHLIHIFTNSLIDNQEMITRILNVFGKFDHFPSKDKIITNSGLITIPYEYLKHFFVPYRTGLPSITKLR